MDAAIGAHRDEPDNVFMIVGVVLAVACVSYGLIHLLKKEIPIMRKVKFLLLINGEWFQSKTYTVAAESAMESIKAQLIQEWSATSVLAHHDSMDHWYAAASKYSTYVYYYNDQNKLVEPMWKGSFAFNCPDEVWMVYNEKHQDWLPAKPTSMCMAAKT